MNLLELEAAVQNAQLADIVLVGFVDHSEQLAQFRALLDAVYVELQGIFLEIATIRDTGRARIDIVTEPRIRAELDDDMTPAISSVRQQVLRDPNARNVLRALRLWGVAETDAELSCAALSFELENGQSVFLDPFNPFGIRIGGNEQNATWLASTATGGSAPTELILRAGQGRPGKDDLSGGQLRKS
jgi:hypothetical protein